MGWPLAAPSVPLFRGGGLDCADELWMGGMADPEGIGPAATPDPEGIGPRPAAEPDGIGPRPAPEPDGKADGKAEAGTPPEGAFTPTETVGRPDGATLPPLGREPTAAAELEGMIGGESPMSALDGLAVGRVATLPPEAVSVTPTIPPVAAAS